jgi:phenylacetate-CoA ligase
MFLNRASFHFEFLRLAQDEPAAPGELARIVVTDLYGFAVPLIRYDTGDLAIVDQRDGAQAGALRSVEGRRSEVVFDTAGRQIPPSSISAIFAMHFPDVAQYQVEQEGATTYRLRVSLGPADHTVSELSGAMRDLFGAEAQIPVELLDEIPSEANGKYRSVICRYTPGDT